MEATPFLSSASLGARTWVVPPPPVQLCHRNFSNRWLLSSAANPRRSDVSRDSRGLTLRPKAAVIGNVEAVRIPTSVPVRVAQELAQAGHRYLDVRTPEEFSVGHPSGAINVPYMYRVGSGLTKNTCFLRQVSSHFRKYDEIIVGCQSGKSSLMASTDLLAAGFTAVTDIAGGYAAWTMNRLPIEE